MGARIVKQVISEAESREADAKVSAIVGNVLADIEVRGDEAGRELSEGYDKWSPPSIGLSREQIEELMASLPQQTIDDIEFAQA